MTQNEFLEARLRSTLADALERIQNNGEAILHASMTGDRQIIRSKVAPIFQALLDAQDATSKIEALTHVYPSDPTDKLASQ